MIDEHKEKYAYIEGSFGKWLKKDMSFKLKQNNCWIL